MDGRESPDDKRRARANSESLTRSYDSEAQALNDMADKNLEQLDQRKKTIMEARAARQEQKQRELEAQDGADNDDEKAATASQQRAKEREARAQSKHDKEAAAQPAMVVGDVNEAVLELQRKNKELLINTNRLENQKRTAAFELDKFKDRVEELVEEVAELKAEVRRKNADARERDRTIAELTESVAVLRMEKEQLHEIIRLGPDASAELIAAAGIEAPPASAFAASSSSSAAAAAAAAAKPVEPEPVAAAPSSDDPTALHEHIATLSKQLSEARELHANAEAQLKKLRARAPEAGSTAASTSETFEAQSELIQKLEVTVKRLRQEKSDAEENEDTARRELRKAQREVVRVTAESDELKKENTNLQSQLDKLRQRKAMLSDSPMDPGSIRRLTATRRQMSLEEPESPREPSPHSELGE